MPPNLTFGPPGDQWHYDKATKTYDLTRRSPGGFTLGTSQGIADTSITVAPSLSALVIVDMQNFFLHPSCRDHPDGLAAVEPTLNVIAKCRELGIQVIWLNWGLTDDDLATMPASVSRGFSRSLIVTDDDNPTPAPTSEVPRSGLGADLGAGKGRCLVAGEWNSEIYAPLLAAAVPGDTHCAKNRMSGMWSEEQPLRRRLVEQGTRTLFFAGVNTDQCVLSTLTDAYNTGWDCVLVEDCCATRTPWGREVCLHNIGASFGFVVDSKAFGSGKSTT